MQNFITDIIDGDLECGRHTRITTRFPPEPNGYLHIGHVKSICLNFGLAEQYGGTCHLRFDDTNPTTEDVAFVASMKRDIQWLGFAWDEHLYYASDYYDRLYAHAVELIDKGLAYVCELNEEQVREYRGTITEAGKNSPYRDRPSEESLALFERMRDGQLDEGAAVVRAKIDMSSPNMKMRDPPIYRIKKARHYRTGNKWSAYPLYDFTHCLSDAYEGITHSICTLEFENNRELYDWVLANVTLSTKPLPRQYEFARLNLNYTITSKRKLAELVNEGYVSGWDDPRMPTVAGLRRRGVTAEALRAFMDMIGVAKSNSTVDVGKLEFCIRDDLNQRSPRVMCVLDPLKVVITNYPDGQVEQLDAPYFPPDVGKPGSRQVPFEREIFIERADFMAEPTKKFFRLAPGREVRLRYAYIIRCDEVIRDDAGNIVELRCSYDAAADHKVKGTIHWVSATHALPCTVRVYDRLFNVKAPASTDDLNPGSLREMTDCIIEPAAATSAAGDRLQFERQGYFYADCIDSKPGALVFNRTITLRDTWAKMQAAPKPEPSQTKRKTPSGKTPSGKTPRSRPDGQGQEALSADVQARCDAFVTRGVAAADARRLALAPGLGALFDDATAHTQHAAALAKWIVNEVAGQATGAVVAQSLAELVELVESGKMTATAGKGVLAAMRDGGGNPRDIVAEKGLEQIGSESELAPVIAEVIAAHPEPAARFRDGDKKLMGFFVGQAMRATKGRADAGLVRRLLQQALQTK